MNESILKHTIITAAIMIAFTVIGTFILAYTYDTTKTPIAKAEDNVRMALFQQLLPKDLYDNDLLHDGIKIPTGGELGNREETMLYRARVKGAPSAVILQTTAPDGYSGDIKLLIAIKAGGEIAGVRVLTHKETPGLGDYIDIEHSSWIKNFDGQSLVKTDDNGWHVKKDGGRFDYMTGATITPRAVIKAVHKALSYYDKNRNEIFNAPATKESVS